MYCSATCNSHELEKHHFNYWKARVLYYYVIAQCNKCSITTQEQELACSVTTVVQASALPTKVGLCTTTVISHVSGYLLIGAEGGTELFNRRLGDFRLYGLVGAGPVYRFMARR